MNELTLHPNVYATGHSKGLISILERVWVREHTPGDGTLYVVSGFANYNGGVRFFETFKEPRMCGCLLVLVGACMLATVIPHFWWVVLALVIIMVGMGLMSE